MRKLPDITPPDAIVLRKLEVIEQTREYKLITPLYGGGNAPGEADPITVVRAAEIRGSLRFWWRATRGGLANGDLEKLKSLEAAIWGKAYVKDKKDKIVEKENLPKNEDNVSQQTVQIEVTILQRGEAKRPFDIVEEGNRRKLRIIGVPEYAAFPLRPTNDDLNNRRKTKNQLEDEMKKVQHGVSFKLKIMYHKAQKEDVEAALWAWETFGGVGARTRRGFGALQLLKVDDKENKQLPPSNRSEEVRHWLSNNLQLFVVPGTWPENVPHLEHSLKFGIPYSRNQVFDAWKSLIGQYASFRQSRSKGFTGRSNWPEAETIRHLTDRRFESYNALSHPQKFPRAAFGLPIIFHFKDDTRGDPGDTTLQGKEKGSERFASPLVLRPLVCSGGSAVGLAALLQGSRVPPLVLKETNHPDEPVEAQLNQQDLTLLPGLRLNGKTNVLQAFINSLGG